MDEVHRKGGKRWFALLGAHVAMFVFAGTYRSFGVLLVEWKKYFDTSSAMISAIMSILAGSVLLSGFISGPFINRFGCHNSLILAGVFLVSGTLMGAFAPNPVFLCFSSGFIWGLGVGFTKNAAHVVPALYFKKGYSRANGIVSAGVAIGIMVVPPVLQLCIDTYGWRGTMFIFAGVQAHVIVAGLLTRPPKSRTKSLTVSAAESSSSSSRKIKYQENDTDLTALQPLNSDCDSNNACDGLVRVGDDKCTIKGTCLSSNSGKSEENVCDYSRIPKEQFSVEKGSGDSVTKEMLECDAANNATTQTLPNDEYGATAPSPDTCMQLTKMNEEIKSTASDTATSELIPSRFRRMLKSSGFMLFGESVGFILVQICHITTGISYTAIMTHFVASTVYAGIDKQSASFLLSVLGIASLIARLSVGWFIDLKMFLPEHMFAFSMALFGTATILSRASDLYGWFVFIALLFGAGSGMFKCLVPVVLRKYVGVENLAPALGVTAVFNGVGDLVGPIFAGALYDASSNYDVPFYTAGSILLVSSGLLLLEPPLTRYKERITTEPLA